MPQARRSPAVRVNKSATAEPGDRVEKVGRLIGTTLTYIAEAMSMPRADVDDIARLLLGPGQPEARAVGAAAITTIAAVVPANPAELPDTPQVYRLVDETGQFLRKDGVGLTRDRAKAWKGTAPQYETIFKRQPQWNGLEPVKAS